MDTDWEPAVDWLEAKAEVAAESKSEDEAEVDASVEEGGKDTPCSECRWLGLDADLTLHAFRHASSVPLLVTTVWLPRAMLPGNWTGNATGHAKQSQNQNGAPGPEPHFGFEPWPVRLHDPNFYKRGYERTAPTPFQFGGHSTLALELECVAGRQASVLAAVPAAECPALVRRWMDEYSAVSEDRIAFRLASPLFLDMSDELQLATEMRACHMPRRQWRRSDGTDRWTAKLALVNTRLWTRDDGTCCLSNPRLGAGVVGWPVPHPRLAAPDSPVGSIAWIDKEMARHRARELSEALAQAMCIDCERIVRSYAIEENTVAAASNASASPPSRPRSLRTRNRRGFDHVQPRSPSLEREVHEEADVDAWAVDEIKANVKVKVKVKPVSVREFRVPDCEAHPLIRSGVLGETTRAKVVWEATDAHAQTRQRAQLARLLERLSQVTEDEQSQLPAAAARCVEWWHAVWTEAELGGPWLLHRRMAMRPWHALALGREPFAFGWSVRAPMPVSQQLYRLLETNGFAPSACAVVMDYCSPDSES